MRTGARHDVSTAPVDDRPDRGRWTAVLWPWIVSQVISGAALLAAGSWPFDDGLHFTSFTTRWDGGYYLGIAESGYGPVDTLFPRWPFAPGLPAIIRGLGDLGIDERIGVHVVNQLAFLVALLGVWVLAQRHGSARVALLSVWALALFPAAFIFSMTYPSALFLAAMVWAFVVVEDRHDVAAGLLAATATLLRPNGLVVALALVVAVWSTRPAELVRRGVLVLGPAVLALAGWCAYCWDRTGDPLVWLSTKDKWQEISVLDAVSGGAKWSILPHVALAAAALTVVVLRRRRLPLSWLVLTGLVILPAAVTGLVGSARYAVECFPPFVAGGQLLDRWSVRVRVALLTGSGVGLFVFAFVVGRYDLVP
jgi:hypothetical protein